ARSRRPMNLERRAAAYEPPPAISRARAGGHRISADSFSPSKSEAHPKARHRGVKSLEYQPFSRLVFFRGPPLAGPEPRAVREINRAHVAPGARVSNHRRGVRRDEVQQQLGRTADDTVVGGDWRAAGRSVGDRSSHGEPEPGALQRRADHGRTGM